jgi:hypothetical protein
MKNPNHNDVIIWIFDTSTYLYTSVRKMNGSHALSKMKIGARGNSRSSNLLSQTSEHRKSVLKAKVHNLIEILQPGTAQTVVFYYFHLK